MVLAARKTDRKLVTAKNAGQNWKPDALAYLSRHYGLLADEEIAAFLGRSKASLKIAAYRKLEGQKRKDNFYTSAEVARGLGIRDAKSIIRWIRKGWLAGKRGPFFIGLNQVWSFSEANIIECLRRRPWLVLRRNVRQYIFQNVVDEEWERDRWYTPTEAMPLLGVKTPDAVHKYIYQGLLPAEKKPGGPWQGIWIIRHSAIERLLASDAREKHRHDLLSDAQRNARLLAGSPVRLTTTWKMRCPSCHHDVEIIAPGDLRGPQVRDQFIAIYVNSTCSHGSQCYLNGGKAAPVMPARCPKCGGRLRPCEDGKECFECGKIVYRNSNL